MNTPRPCCICKRLATWNNDLIRACKCEKINNYIHVCCLQKRMSFEWMRTCEYCDSIIHTRTKQNETFLKTWTYMYGDDFTDFEIKNTQPVERKAESVFFDEIKINENEKTCVVCYETETVHRKLLSPCNCRGSIQFIHDDCLQILKTTLRTTKCRTCNTVYKITNEAHGNRHNNNEFFLFMYDPVTGEYDWNVFLRLVFAFCLGTLIRQLLS
jgi:hypothetical protein